MSEKVKHFLSNFKLPGKGWVILGILGVTLTAWAAVTTLNQVALQNSTIDSTVIGGTTPSTGTFTYTHGTTIPPAFPTQGGYSGWNNQALGETDFFNHAGLGTGGYYWFNGRSTQSVLAYLDNNGNLHATNFTGTLIGNVQGNLQGNVTGSLTGTVNGTLNGNVNGGSVSGSLGAFNLLVANPQGTGGGFNPAPYTAGAFMSWNQTGNTIGEVDFISLHTSAMNGGFNWYNTTGTLATNQTPLMSLSSIGTLTVASVNANTTGTHTGPVVGNATTASAFDHTPVTCATANQWATGITANGTPGCSTAVYGRTVNVNSTGSGPYSQATTTVPLSAVMPDPNYSATCAIVNPFGIPSIMGISKTTTSITVTIVNGGTSGSEVVSGGAELDCNVNGT